MESSVLALSWDWCDLNSPASKVALLVVRIGMLGSSAFSKQSHRIEGSPWAGEVVVKKAFLASAPIQPTAKAKTTVNKPGRPNASQRCCCCKQTTE